MTFFEIPLYKIALALFVFFIFLFLRKVFTLTILKTIKQFTKNTKTDIDDKILKILNGPIKFSFIIIGFYFFAVILDIKTSLVSHIIKTLITFVVFWILFGIVNVFDNFIYEFSKKFGKDLYKEIGNFLIKTLKAFVLAVGMVAILQDWGINVSAFIASLGIGGLAFALAAKDTAANLFGGLTILADQSLKMGDWVKVGSVEGTVEDIGLRTTKIRTFEKSLIVMPNQTIANSPIENFSRRGQRRIKLRIGVTYSTPRETLQKIVKDITLMLQNHPQIAQDQTLLVRFDEFGDSALGIFIYTFVNSAVWSKYLEVKEDVYLKIMQIVEENGAEFAFPSQSIYIEKINKEEK
ncbi:MAG: mechanosensitive ion channel family protein [Epsilonproteobacteria bacterium]|nr:mechanosensitive ion channel family protein [Campylobacterota bacterium]